MKRNDIAPLSEQEESNQELRDILNRLQASSLRNSNNNSVGAGVTIEKYFATRVAEKFLPQLFHDEKARNTDEN